MAAELITLPFRPVINTRGVLEPGALLDVFQAGTTTRINVFSDSDLSAALSNPVVANSSGVFPSVYWDNVQAVRVRVRESDGTVLGDADPYYSDGLSSTDLSFLQSGTGAQTRTVQAKLRDTPKHVTDYAGADPTGATSSSAAFANAGGKVSVPSGTYSLGTTVTLNGPYTWTKDQAASFTGAGTINTPDIVGFNYNPNIRFINSLLSDGTVAAPSTHPHPVAGVVKHSDFAWPGSGLSVPAFYVANNKWMDAAGDRVQGIYAEVIERAGGVNTFIEGGRFHAINALGGSVGGDVYGLITYAQAGAGSDDPASKFVQGIESEIARVNGSDAAFPTAWTSANNLDTNYNATVSQGKMPLANYLVNPYNAVGSRVGFMVGNSFAASGVNTPVCQLASFGTFEDNVTFGLMVRGANVFAAISTANNMTILRARNAADNADHNLLSYDVNNFFVVGTEAASIVAASPIRQYLAPSVSPIVNGELVVEATSNTSLTFKYRGSDGTTRTASMALT
jgi:hypothetical protein